MFDNTTKEVNDLTAICKAQLERCNGDLKTLQQHGTVNVNQTTAQHFKILIDSLRRRLGDHGKKFKELLESRSEVLKRQHKRRQNFASNDVAVAQLPPSAPSSNGTTAPAVLLQFHLVVDCVNAQVFGNPILAVVMIMRCSRVTMTIRSPAPLNFQVALLIDKIHIDRPPTTHGHAYRTTIHICRRVGTHLLTRT